MDFERAESAPALGAAYPGNGIFWSEIRRCHGPGRIRANAVNRCGEKGALEKHLPSGGVRVFVTLPLFRAVA